MILKKWIPSLLLLILALLASPAFSSGYGPRVKDSWDDQFHRQIGEWVKEISLQGGPFSSWKGAKQEITALGPGLRTWLVMLENKDQKVGYMVVGENEKGGFLLLEYGTEGSILFSDALLSSYDLPMKGVKKKIYRGLSSYYLIESEGETKTYDAKTLEEIPPEWSGPEERDRPYSLMEEEFSSLKKITGSKLDKRSEWEEAFPVEAILKPRSPIKNPSELMVKKAYLELSIWDGMIHLLLPVVGVHLWDDKTYYVAVDQEGYRFLPLLPEKKETEAKEEPSVSIQMLFTISSGS